MRFPKNPLEGVEGRFSDEAGNNPYSDGGPPAEQLDDNPYSAPTDESEPVYQPEYVEAFSHRAGQMLRMASIGIATSVLFNVALLLIMLGMIQVPVQYGILLSFANLALTVPAMVMCRNDIIAMKAGAMDSSGLRRTRVSFYVSMLGALISLGACSSCIVIAFFL